MLKLIFIDHVHKFFFDCPTLSLQEITALCQSLYFPAEQYTIATFITVHIALYFLFRDLTPHDVSELNMTKEEVSTIVDMCLENGEIAARNLRLFLHATLDNIQALMLGVFTFFPGL